MLGTLRGQRAGQDTRYRCPLTPRRAPLPARGHASLPPPEARAGTGAGPGPPGSHVGGAKGAPPAATFRWLLPRSRPLLARPGLAAAAAARPYGVRASDTGELVTHTGQVYDEKDYRRVRFVGRQKEVNKNFAIDLIAEQPVSQVESRVISCDGGGGALGHPKVYINLDKETKTGTCGYCGLQFKQKHH
nr:NADH dehydrogenase [ubiquinone] iron-sulfur protein 6, mitochondrial [Zonotrichia albicollis]